MLFGQEHVKRYQETDGAEGHEWQRHDVLILTTTGRRSGEARSTPLIYRDARRRLRGGRLQGRRAEHPGVVLNLERATQRSTVQVLASASRPRLGRPRPRRSRSCGRS